MATEDAAEQLLKNLFLIRAVMTWLQLGAIKLIKTKTGYTGRDKVSHPAGYNLYHRLSLEVDQW